MSAVKSKPRFEELEDDPEASEPEVETTRPKRKKPLQALALLYASIIGTVAVAAKFLPSLLGDHPGWASLLLNPMEAAIRFPQESLAAVGVAVCATWISLSLRWTQGAMRSALRGGAAFSTIGIGLFIAIDSLPREIHLFDQRTVTIHPNPEPRWVEIRGQAGTLTAIHDRASDSGKLVATASVGERFVLSGIPTDNASGWLRIHLAPGNLAWISKKSSADGPAHAIDPATDIQLGEAEALALGLGLIAATAAILLGWWRDWLERQIFH